MRKVIHEICIYCDSPIDGSFDTDHNYREIKCPTCHRAVTLCSICKCKTTCDRDDHMVCCMAKKNSSLARDYIAWVNRNSIRERPDKPVKTAYWSRKRKKKKNMEVSA